MRITWDEPKRIANLAKHGLDFSDYETCFDVETALELPARASVTGRRRKTLVGWWSGRIVVAAIVSQLGREAIAIVSLRPASQKERDLYDAH